MQTRLGLEIGAGAIGWCLFELDQYGNPAGIRDLGVRVFPDGRDPRSRLPLATGRRNARAARRRRDRYVRRRTALLKALTEIGLLPAEAAAARRLAGRDPYRLRAEGLDVPLTPHDFGRALFHLGQRRGFQFNRKLAGRAEGQRTDGPIAQAVAALDRAMAASGARTYGEFLFQRREAGGTSVGASALRVRPDTENGSYLYYPERRHLLAEFEALWKAQSVHHPALLAAAARERIGRIIFFQRPVARAAVGSCAFFAQDERIARAHPLSRARHLYEKVNLIEVVQPDLIARPLTLAERDRLVAKLGVVRKASLAVLGRLIGLAPGEALSSPGADSSAIAGDEIGAAFSRKGCLGRRWSELDVSAQWAVIERVANEPDAEALAAWLIKSHGISAEAAAAVAQISLPHGYDRLGIAATRLVVSELRLAVISGSEAVRRVFGVQADFRMDGPPGASMGGGKYARLPYYGQVLSREITPGTLMAGDEDERRWGKINQPSLHLAFNQLRKLTNALIELHGRPDEIVHAISRDLRLSERDKIEAAGRGRGYARAAVLRSERLIETDRPDSGRNRALLKLWQELAPETPEMRACPFCGTGILEEKLFSDEIAIAHILPFSRSFDDSWSNRTVAHRSCIVDKGLRTPWEAWGTSERWPLIIKAAERLDRGRRWRFGPSAMARTEDSGGAVTGQLSDRHRISVMTRRYLACLYDDGGAVRGTPGRLTGLLRRKWDLNSILPDHCMDDPGSHERKGSLTRTDIRHGAIDAAVVGLMAPRFLDVVAESISFVEAKGKGGLFDDLPEAWEGFRVELKDRIAKVWVSHKADHGRAGQSGVRGGATGGRLHNETAYGLTGQVSERGLPIVVHTVALGALKPADVFDAGRIAGKDLRLALAKALAGLEGKAFQEGLARFSQSDPVFGGIRRVRIRQALTVIPVRDRNGRIYKGFKGDANAIYEVWEMPDGRWVAQVISMFDVHQPDFVPQRPHPAARKVLSLHQNDMIALSSQDEEVVNDRQIMRVLSIGSNGQIRLAAHCEGGSLRERDALPNTVDPFKFQGLTPGGLKRRGARKVHVDILGRVRDPGAR